MKLIKIIYTCTLTFFISIIMFAQEPDPNSFFPSSVGNVWEYDQVWGFAREEIYKDSIGENGHRYLFYKYNDYYTPNPRYKLDTSSAIVFRVPFNPNNTHWLYVKLDADTGDVWIVDSLEVGGNVIYQLALCRNQYDGFFLNYSTTFKEFTFYQYQPDTVINEFSWPDYTITLASGIGEVMHFDEGGGGPQRVLLGCIIDGDTIGPITTSADDIEISLLSFELFQNYPNPFNPITNIRFQTANFGFVSLKVYDVLGNEIRTLVNEEKPAGEYQVTFNGSNLASGIYVYRIKTNGKIISKKMTLLQ
ncbi:MAG: T9SS type A sorting domain-containing protein [Bacteroidetes bacterium]|nr:T9SS type A sorting domain-containing protein [Bacteroidota bacterium]